MAITRAIVVPHNTSKYKHLIESPQKASNYKHCYQFNLIEQFVIPFEEVAIN